MMRLLIVTSVQAEAEAIGPIDDARLVVSGIGRTNAAAATTEAIIRDGPFGLVICAGVAGVLPAGGLSIAETIVATACVYFEEGVMTPGGFENIAAMGFALGDFEGNVVPVDPEALSRLGDHFRYGPIATVATCSGSDEAAREVVQRTGAVAEAMEGAAVVHAAHRLGVGALELRTISNTTGNRPQQVWRLDDALAALGPAVREMARILRGP
ncbi:MAG: futalosine hydrolase [Phycisphaerales bacterium]